MAGLGLRSPLPALLLVVLSLACLAQGARAFTWTPCTPDPAPSSFERAVAADAAKAAAPPLLTPTAVTLTPDPPVIGSSVEFLIKGPLSAPITQGTIGLRVKFEGVELYEEEADVCEKLEGGCGGGGGGGGGQAGGAEASIKYVQELPPIAPPGHYSVRVVGNTGESVYGPGDALVCVDVEFDMVLPSARKAAADVGGKRTAGGASVAVV